MSTVVILGLGNDLLSDDAVGLRVVHEVRTRVAGDRRIDVHETTEMGLALLDFIVGYDCLIVVDSVQTGAQPPGFVHEWEAPARRDYVRRTPHAIGVDRLCCLGRLRGLAVPRRIRIFAVEVADVCTVGIDMTPEVSAAVDAAADAVVERALEFARLPAEQSSALH